MIGFLRIFFKENNPVLVGVHVSWEVLCYLADFPTISPSPNEQHYGMDIGKKTDENREMEHGVTHQGLLYCICNHNIENFPSPWLAVDHLLGGWRVLWVHQLENCGFAFESRERRSNSHG